MCHENISLLNGCMACPMTNAKMQLATSTNVRDTEMPISINTERLSPFILRLLFEKNPVYIGSGALSVHVQKCVGIEEGIFDILSLPSPSPHLLLRTVGNICSGLTCLSHQFLKDPLLSLEILPTAEVKEHLVVPPQATPVRHRKARKPKDVWEG